MDEGKEIYSDVIDYIFHAQGTYILAINSNIYKSEKGSLEFVVETKDARKILNYDYNSILILDSLNKPTILNLISKNKKSLHPIDDFRVSSINEKFIFFYTKKPKRNNGVYDRKKQKIIFMSDKPIRDFIFEDKIISILNGVISLLHLENNSLLWEQDLSQMGSYVSGLFNRNSQRGEIKKIIGVYNNKIIVYLTGWMILGINLITGEIDINISSKNHVFQNPELNSSVLEDLYNIFIDQNKEIVYVFQGRKYIEISLKEQEIIKVKDFENDFSYKGLYIKHAIKTDDNIFFSAMRRETWKLDSSTNKVGYTNVDSLGQFNLETNDIEWLKPFNLGETFLTDKLKTFNNKIGVTDNKDHLHIIKT